MDIPNNPISANTRVVVVRTPELSISKLVFPPTDTINDISGAVGTTFNAFIYDTVWSEN